MADQKNKAKQYQSFEDKRETKRPILLNCVKAFLVGGFICLIGQVITTFYIYYFDFTEQTAGNPTTATLIFITMILTGFGLYNRLGQFAGAGSAVPVTGFGNAVISAAMEHRTEGFILGVGTNMFKLAGPVIVYGVFAAFVIALIKTIFLQLGGL
ncbi:stage V sporulation protein AC [Oceanobacillus alkalisoli]|uniref:stage V sporulation protein AC n=1 Tax=Oceanobacillus alkalisoli TaxID=2925113 RepID=UPI001EEFB7DA|nr:stage V sporulation protein AC [Oceanobacillus alkalisoli]MCF3944759.1 stage V sporulation protein AC [Oceanobacillus alkalisoli]MCG5104363.1 stage V sporulation protein AC [Oceanobacillus alkalisoli]